MEMLCICARAQSHDVIMELVCTRVRGMVVFFYVMYIYAVYSDQKV